MPFGLGWGWSRAWRIDEKIPLRAGRYLGCWVRMAWNSVAASSRRPTINLMLASWYLLAMHLGSNSSAFWKAYKKYWDIYQNKVNNSYLQSGHVFALPWIGLSQSFPTGIVIWVQSKGILLNRKFDIRITKKRQNENPTWKLITESSYFPPACWCTPNL